MNALESIRDKMRETLQSIRATTEQIDYLYQRSSDIAENAAKYDLAAELFAIEKLLHHEAKYLESQSKVVEVLALWAREWLTYFPPEKGGRPENAIVETGPSARSADPPTPH